MMVMYLFVKNPQVCVFKYQLFYNAVRKIDF